MTTLDPIKTAPPTAAQLLIAGAVTHLRGARKLAADEDPDVGISFALLVGMALEPALKAYICLRDGTFVPRSLGHDVNRLWERAASLGLKAPRSAWVEDQVRLHQGPDHLARYMGEGHGLTGTTFRPTITELSDLVEEVYGCIYPGGPRP